MEEIIFIANSRNITLDLCVRVSVCVCVCVSEDGSGMFYEQFEWHEFMKWMNSIWEDVDYTKKATQAYWCKWIH